MQQGAAWDSSQACYVCNELEYYEALIATYKAWGRVSSGWVEYTMLLFCCIEFPRCQRGEGGLAAAGWHQLAAPSLWCVCLHHQQ